MIKSLYFFHPRRHTFMPSKVTTTRADTTQWPLLLLIWTRVADSHWPSPKMTRSRMRCTTGSILVPSVTSSPRHRLRWWSLGRITVSHRISRRLVACPLPVSPRQTTTFRHRPRRRKSQSTPGEEGHEYLCVHSCKYYCKQTIEALTNDIWINQSAMSW